MDLSESEISTDEMLTCDFIAATSHISALSVEWFFKHPLWTSLSNAGPFCRSCGDV